MWKIRAIRLCAMCVQCVSSKLAWIGLHQDPAWTCTMAWDLRAPHKSLLSQGAQNVHYSCILMYTFCTLCVHFLREIAKTAEGAYSL